MDDYLEDYLSTIRQIGALPAALTMWAAMTLVLCTRPVPIVYSWGLAFFLWLGLLLPVILYALAGWLREWPWGLLDAKKSLVEIKEEIARAEMLRLGGRAGARVFFSLAWLSLFLVYLDVPLYFYSTWAAYFHQTTSSLGQIAGGADIATVCILIVAWISYWVLVRLFRSRTAFWAMQQQNPEKRWSTYTYPSSEFLLRNPVEANQFLSLFAQACPLREIKSASYLSVIFRLVPTILLSVFRFFEKTIGINATVIPFLDAAVGVLLLFLAVSVTPWLFRETEQWWYADRIPPCSYQPLLRLVLLAQKVRG